MSIFDADYTERQRSLAAPTLYRHCLPEMLAVLTVWALFKLTGVP